MKRLLVILFFFLNTAIYPATYYVATPANGGDNAHPGTFAEPWATWQKAFTTVIAGDTAYIRGGIFYSATGAYGVSISAKNGTSSDRIVILAYQEEKPILDCSNQTFITNREGVYMYDCDYWSFFGLTVRYCTEYTGKLATGWIISQCSYINFDECTVYGCGNGFSASGFCDYIDYTNCDSYKNEDWSDDGGFANGWTLTMYLSPGPICAIGTHVTLTGCRAWENSDDGFDFYGANGYFILNDCWAMNNGYNGGGSGNGDGFKSDYSQAAEDGVQRIYNNCLALDNKGKGFSVDAEGDATHGIQHLYNCVARNNGQHGFGANVGTDIVPHIFRNNIAFDNDMSQYIGKACYTEDHNTWDAGFSVGSIDFVSLDTTGVSGTRDSQGNLPDLNFMKLMEGSNLIDTGVDVELPYYNSAPDLGAFEWEEDIPVPPSSASGLLKVKIGNTWYFVKSGNKLIKQQ